MKISVVLLALIFAYEPPTSGYSVEIKPRKDGRFVIRVKNNNPFSLRCYFANRYTRDVVIVRAKRTSEEYLFREIPSYLCKRR